MQGVLACSWSTSILSGARRRANGGASVVCRGCSSSSTNEPGGGGGGGLRGNEAAVDARSVLGSATRIDSPPSLPSESESESESVASTASIESRTSSIESILRETGRPFLEAVEMDSLSSLSSRNPHRRLNVAVLLSGGVDSSLALYLLHKVAGHNVTAFYLQIWFQEDFRNTWDACPWEEDLEYCRKVCAALGVPLETVPLTDEYWDRVVQHSIGEVRAGRTPNPDMLCNSRVKFGAFYEYLEANHADEFDRVASGHYASLRDGLLALTPDVVKDQTYFLANLKPEQLRKAMFPLGGFDKPTVRALADLADLPTKGRKDSQGICFLGKVKFDEFIKEHLGEWRGPLVDRESGEVVGYHDGYWFYTVGQRKGIGLPGGPWFVVEKDPTWNVVVISRDMDVEADVDVDVNRVFDCVDINWHSAMSEMSEMSERREKSRRLRCKVRHGPHLYGCEVVQETPESLRVTLDAPDQGLAAGQYAVLYDEDDRCVCCGVIRLINNNNNNKARGGRGEQ